MITELILAILGHTCLDAEGAAGFFGLFLNKDGSIHGPGKGGIVRDPELHQKAVDKIRNFVTEELDGGPRILQGRLRVAPTTNPQELMSRVQAVEHQIYPTAADWFGRGRLRFRNGAAVLDGKRLEEPVIQDYA